MRLRTIATRLDMWWHSHGQFSRPARHVSPSRQLAWEWTREAFADPEYGRRALERIRDGVADRYGIAHCPPVPSEEVLFGRIFGQLPAER